MEANFQKEERYNEARKKVDAIKGFYIHLMAYVLVNGFSIFGNYFENNHTHDISNWGTWNVSVLWGIGLLIHGWNAFGQNLFFSPDWGKKEYPRVYGSG